MKVQLKSLSEQSMGLHIVKAIISNTGKGLKESKDLFDKVRDGKPQTIEIADNEKAHRFINEVKDYGLNCGSNRGDVIKKFYKEQGAGPDLDEVLAFMEYNYHITANNVNDGCRYMITDFNDKTIIGMKYGEVWKGELNFEDFADFEINHVSYVDFYKKYYGK